MQFLIREMAQKHVPRIFPASVCATGLEKLFVVYFGKLDRKGIRFAVSSAGGVTEIRVYVSKVLLRRGRWMGWVKAAADRLEMLALLVARQDLPTPRGRAGMLPPGP